MNAPLNTSSLAPAPAAARTATVPPALAPWETLASPGHVKFHRVSLLGARIPTLRPNLYLAFGFLLAALWVVSSMRDSEARVAANWANRVQSWFATGTPIPRVGLPRATWPGLTPEQAAALSTPADVSTWLQSQTAPLATAATLSCCAALKITAAWPIAEAR